jgi:hypothetical protein
MMNKFKVRARLFKNQFIYRASFSRAWTVEEGHILLFITCDIQPVHCPFSPSPKLLHVLPSALLELYFLRPHIQVNFTDTSNLVKTVSQFLSLIFSRRHKPSLPFIFHDLPSRPFLPSLCPTQIDNTYIQYPPTLTQTYANSATRPYNPGLGNSIRLFPESEAHSDT